ncbi:MAG: hypothetical protein ABI619_00950 [Betaproteobacteria bacterium]
MELLLKELLSQEEELQFRELRNDDALSLGMKLVERAKAGAKSVTVDICRNAPAALPPRFARNFGR